MSTTAAVIEQALADARAGLIQADDAGIATAETALAQVEHLLPEISGATERDIQQLGRGIQRVGRLVQALHAFHEGLARLTSVLDDAVANYTRDGVTRAVPVSEPSVSMHG